MLATFSINQECNGIEVTFDGKPSDQVRDRLKKAGYRWHKVKKLWYARQTEARLKLAEEVSNGTTADNVQEVSSPAEKKNKHGVVVGDVFSMSWGYEQTNVDFFQVIELVGTTSARVVEVYPPIIDSMATGPDAEDRVYKIGRELLPRNPRSIFINDNEKGDLKRVQVSNYSGEPYIRVGHDWAYLKQPGEHKEYVSWYY